MTLMLRYAARSDVGLIRTNNEDAVYAGPRLVAIADGMGGHAAGDVASAVTIATLAPLDDDDPPSDLLGALDQAIRQANDQLRQMMDADSELDGMGTTLTALLWSGGRLGLAHIGDSRAYLLRDGVLTQITHDHTLVQHLVDEGELDEADVPTHPQRSALLRVLNGRPDSEADLSIREARAGDRYLLCSDGLSGVVSHDTLRDTLTIPDPERAVDALIDLALRGGAPDNVTCVVCDVVASGAASSTVPVVGGSVADGDDARLGEPDTSAGRAAALRDHRRPAPRHRPDDEPTRRRWRGPALVLGLLVIVAAALFGGTWLYSQYQYYVGSNGTNVVIYKGINGSVLGLSFSSPVRDTGIAMSALPAFERDKVAETITARSRRDADRIVSQLHQTGTSTPPSPDTSSPPQNGSAPASPPASATASP
ncbi:MAG: family protein phosphatase [Actinomycetota bacterium]|nr:family protein phosphatase [Actinomycetota bacterium]